MKAPPMISQSAAQTLFAYHWHTGRTLLELAAQLADAQYHAAPGPNLRSAHALLRHVLVTDWAWRLGLESGRQPEPPPATEFSDLASLREGYAAEEAAWSALLGSLSDADMAADLTLTALNGYVLPVARWRVVQHLALHGMQHYAELAQLLTNYGHSPGDIDFIFFRGA
jgi:uncharacterized damage-inducible protein DinB